MNCGMQLTRPHDRRGDRQTRQVRTGQVEPEWTLSLGHMRLTVCIATLNCLARHAIGLLRGSLQLEIGWNEIGYATSSLSSNLLTRSGFFGKLMDRIATRRGYSWSVWPWSIAAMAHALGPARSATTDMGVRAWQIHDRSYPVAVSVLAARLLI